MSDRDPKEPSLPALLERLSGYVKEHDPPTDAKYAQVAGLLAEAATEAQRHGRVPTQLSERTDELLEAPAPAVTRHFDTQADWCEDILNRSDGPRRYSESGQLEKLLNQVGKGLTPAVTCVLTTKNRGAGVPDDGMLKHEVAATRKLREQRPVRAFHSHVTRATRILLSSD